MLLYFFFFFHVFFVLTSVFESARTHNLQHNAPKNDFYSLLVSKKYIIFSEWLHFIFKLSTEAYSELSKTSNMKRFAKVIDRFYSLTIFAKRFIFFWMHLCNVNTTLYKRKVCNLQNLEVEIILNCFPKFLVSIARLIGFITQYLYSLSLAQIN